MKKAFLFLFFVLFSFIFFAQYSQAVPDIGLGSNGMAGKVAGKAGYDASVSDSALAETVAKIIKAVLSLVGIIFLGLTVYAGFLWMTARGAEEQISNAKGIISAAIIGLAITLSAYAITTFVVSKLVQSTTGVEVGNGAGGGGAKQCGTPELPGTGCVANVDVMPNDIINPQGSASCGPGFVCVGP